MTTDAERAAAWEAANERRAEELYDRARTKAAGAILRGEDPVDTLWTVEAHPHHRERLIGKFLKDGHL